MPRLRHPDLPVSAVAALPLLDPRTGRVRGELVPGRTGEVTGAVAAARSAFAAWGRLVPRERAHRLERLAALIEEHAEAYVERERAGTGKPAREAAGEVAEAAGLFRFYAWAARTGTSPAAGSLIDGHESWVRWEPVGVVAAIVPWNYPLMMAAWRCAPALAVRQLRGRQAGREHTGHAGPARRARRGGPRGGGAACGTG
ncbi:aldehyde dehydrogenase family protein [Streptomyces lasalocidi]